MIWICTDCGHKVPRYDKPAGERELWCLVCWAMRKFISSDKGGADA